MIGRRNRKLAFLAFCVALAAVVAATWGTRFVGLSWDEGDYFDRAERCDAWLAAVALGPSRVDSDKAETELGGAARRFFGSAPSRRALFSEDALAAAFPHAIYREGHPAGTSILCALGCRIYDGLRLPESGKVSRRFGVILLFGAALGAVFYRIGTSLGVWRALAGVVFIGTSPQVFGSAQFLGGDSILISSFLLAWALYDGARYSTWRAICWGGALGLALCGKFSGFLILAPFFVASLFELKASRRVFARLALGVGVALALFVALNPPLWRAPISGFATFWRLNTMREGYNIPIWFFGKFYSPQSPPPFWNGFFWIAVSIPSLTLALGLLASVARAGARQALRDARFKRAFYLALAFGIIFPVARMTPGVPVHDGVRLLIASAPFWGVLAAASFLTVRRRLVPCVLCLTALVSCVDLARAFPQPLSFYGAVVGGGDGAESFGLETTYYWDALDADFARFLREQVESARDAGEAEGVLFGAFSSQTLEYYRLWNVFGTSTLGTISNPADLDSLEKYRYYVLQVRPSGFSALDFALLKSAKPVFVKRLRCGAPVLLVFVARDVEKIVKAPESERGLEE